MVGNTVYICFKSIRYIVKYIIYTENIEKEQTYK